MLFLVNAPLLRKFKSLDMANISVIQVSPSSDAQMFNIIWAFFLTSFFFSSHYFTLKGASIHT